MPEARVGRAVAIAVFLFAWTLTTHGKFSASGDEPHYLMIAESLRADGDLDLSNNYAHDDGRLFGHSGLAMGPHARPTPSGPVWSVHDVGLPFALLPVYAAAQRAAAVPSERLLQRFRMTRGLFAYSLVSLFLIAATALAAGCFAGALRSAVGSAPEVLLASAALISPPVVSYTFLVFPETVALGVTLVVLWYVLDAGRHRPSTTVAVAAALGLLPWVHRKYTFYVFGLAFLILLRRERSLRQLTPSAKTAAAALFVLPQAALHAWTWWNWRSIGGPQLIDTLPFSAGTFAGGLAGLWLDRVHGVVAYGPLFLVAPACCWLERRTAWPFLVPAALLYVPMAAFVDWIGGFSTAARYVVPALPLLLVPVALALRRRMVRMVFAALLVLQTAIDGVVWQHPRTLWPGAMPGNAALESLAAAGRWYERLLPSIWTDGLTGAVAPVVLAIVLASALIVRMASRDDTPRGTFSATM